MRLLDVGCGTGQFLALSQKAHGWEVFGNEFSEEPVRLARERHGLTVARRELADDPGEAGYDVITMWGLLEHVFV